MAGKKKKKTKKVKVEEVEEKPKESGEKKDSSGGKKEDGKKTKGKKKQGPKFVWIFVYTLIILGALAAGYFIYNTGTAPRGEVEREIATAPSPTMTSETQAPELDRSELTIQILNGAGEPGVASTAQEYLENLGYEVSEIGNAESFDYEETVVSLKEVRSEFEELLIDDLGENYVVSDEVETLDEDSDYDAVITIGL